jgi:hypothetical protein
LSDTLDALIANCTSAWQQERSGLRLRSHLLSQLLCLGNHTVTGLLTTLGQQFEDWSASYRLYAASRIDTDVLFNHVLQGIKVFQAPSAPVVVALDDSLLPKRGRKIPGAAWRRDPQGPPFQTNFVWAQRVLQLSAALPYGQQGAARMIPIDFFHAPTAVRPPKQATEAQIESYKEARKRLNINVIGVERVKHLIGQLDRPLHLAVDGRFTNRTVLRGIPNEVSLTGRIREDAQLYAPPAPTPATGQRGRPVNYGTPLPTPKQMRQDENRPWETVEAYATGKRHDFRVKTLLVKWRPAGPNKILRLIIVAPLGYRLRKGSALLYRKPAYLICTNPALPLPAALQEALWRWDIEVNFRDEKTILGVGQAQVRNPNSVQDVPASAVAAYALLLLAAAQTYGPAGMPDTLPRPSWQLNQLPRRATTNNLINELRYELWGRGIHNLNFSGFTSQGCRPQKPAKFLTPLESAAFYAGKG